MNTEFSLLSRGVVYTNCIIHLERTLFILYSQVYKPFDIFCLIYRESNSHYSCRSQTQSIADKTEYIKQISGLLGSKDFRERIKGIDQLATDCQHNPNMVINSIFPVSVSFVMCFVMVLSYHHSILFHHENITNMCLFPIFVLLPPVSFLSGV